jgi:hypothetical protein
MTHMATYRGTIKRSEFGGGWELHTQKGEVFELDGGGPFADGASVEITGAIDDQAMSISMRGPTLKVKSSRTL